MFSIMSTRIRWLEAALDALEHSGAPGIRIDRLAAALGLSKGSFHHHFDGAESFKRAVLDRYEELALSELDALADELATRPPQAALATLTEKFGTSGGVVLRPKLDVAVRAWAFQDVDAHSTQGRVDAARIKALENIWSRLVDDPRRARLAAILPYLVAVGATVIVPPIGREELFGAYAMLLEVVPAIADPD